MPRLRIEPYIKEALSETLPASIALVIHNICKRYVVVFCSSYYDRET